MASYSHLPVLLKEVLELLRPVNGGRYLDGTLGAGGHAYAILTASSPAGRLLGLDIDRQAIALAKDRLAVFGERATIVHASFATLARQMQKIGWDQVDGILFDFGVSSMQFDTPARGFSFMHSGPLDMRFDAEAGKSAAELINTYSEEDLAAVLREYGEERRARQIAKAVISARPIQTTKELAQLIVDTVGSSRHRIHPATRSFQALRIAVNDELHSIEAVLLPAIQALKPGGRLNVISFHSLEDRIVKRFIRERSRPPRLDPNLPPTIEDWQPSLKEITRKPVTAKEDEIKTNPRARSAKLRAAEKL